MTDTKDSILNSAERLFAERGYEATSLRAVTSEAGVNLAAVNYHFRSKDQLLKALFTRGMQRLNRERTALLDAYEAECGGKPVPPEKLVHALIGPMLDASRDRSRGREIFGMLLGRMYASPKGPLDDILVSDIEAFSERFKSAIRRALPGTSLEELYWRSFFAIGATAHTLISSRLIGIISNGLCDADDREAVLERLIRFIVAGLQAPERQGAKGKKAGPTGKKWRGK
ncbi:MAG: TetR family transcriptional regulator [Acidobacteria bacterium]|nr:TetR family transcriptional regulator [Acidobacteriota bacterium]